MPNSDITASLQGDTFAMSNADAIDSTVWADEYALNGDTKMALSDKGDNNTALTEQGYTRTALKMNGDANVVKM